MARRVVRGGKGMVGNCIFIAKILSIHKGRGKAGDFVPSRAESGDLRKVDVILQQ